MSKPLTRRTFLAGAAGLAGATALTACGGNSGNNNGGSAPSGSTGTTKAAANAELTYQFLTTVALPDVGLVQNAMNAYLASKGKSFTVKLSPLDSTTFEQRMPLAFAAGNAGDVVFTANWANDFYQNASTGNYLALDELLPQYAPGLWKSLSADVWQVAKVGGKLYGAINVQLWPYTYGFVAREDIAQKYGLEADKITTYADLDPYLKEIHAGEPSMTVWWTDSAGHGDAWGGGTLAFDLIGAFGAAIRPDDANLTIVNMFDSDEYRDACALMRKWHQAGYTTPNPQSATDAESAWTNGKTALQASQADRGTVFPFPVVQKRLIPLVLTTNSITATLSAVNHDTKHPQEAMEFIEMLNTDKDFFNLISFGIEGKHYVFTDKANGVVGFPKGVTAANDRYNPNTDWQFGNQFNAYYRSEDQATAKLWEQQKSINDSSAPSKALGFTPQTDSIKTEVTSVTAAMSQYKIQTGLGLVDASSGVKTFVDKMNDAGFKKIQSELQSQIDKWAESK